MSEDPIVITSFARTPIGDLLGVLKDLSAPQLGQHVIKAATERASLLPHSVSEVIMGCVLPAGTGQAPARQAALGAGIPTQVPCTTINKVCGSGMKAIMFGKDLLATGQAEVVIAGGMESMTQAPFMLKKARAGYRLGSGELLDHMMFDGLQDAYDHKPMGHYGEDCALQFKITRAQLDTYAQRSFTQARLATEKNLFATEIVPIAVAAKNGEEWISKDQHPFSVKPERIPQLKPVFKKDGCITAGNASSIADGAAAISLMRRSQAEKLGLTPLAKIVATQSSARLPSEFPIAPIDAVTMLLEKINWKPSEVDLFEINEAFAVVTLAFMQALNVPLEKMNIHGGACALGHPIGASGARIIVTLIAAMIQNKMQRGVAALCIGGGEATAVAIELINE